jgi:hypothetical protein
MAIRFNLEFPSPGYEERRKLIKDILSRFAISSNPCIDPHIRLKILNYSLDIVSEN